ncbi:hypothetical protein TNCV_2565291 [Trichonephila clavipes]|uniref:Uncharacterized protein n=1 Tax=Trichonephila clavipes TaxID=2585209 RepID=A0A8X6SE21_TRICX|nr:hypothetical protein TNCV_2565291 [Trichonephila clavipes]
MLQIQEKDGQIELIALRITFPFTVQSRSSLKDHWIFSDLKKMLQGKRFGSDEEGIAKVEANFENKIKSFYEKGIVVSDTDCYAVGTGFESQGGTLNSRRAASLLVRFVEGEERSSGRVEAYRASTPQVRALFPGSARSTKPFIPNAVGR